MKNKFFAKSFFLAKTILLVLTLLTATTILNAQNNTTFAQFNERVGGQDFIFKNNTINASFETVAGGSPITFTYLNVAGLPPELQGPQNAHIFIVATTTAPATTNAQGNRLNQPFNSLFTIEILRDTPYNGANNLLTANVRPVGTSNPELTGDLNATSAGFTASTPVQQVDFTSSFISFTGSTSRDLGLTFTSVQPVFTLGGTFVNSFTAAGAGSFAANQIPIFMIPTAARVAVGGQVLTPKGRGLANARVTMTTSAGESYVTWTDDFGVYQFLDVSAGDTVIIEVKSKLYSYPTQVLSLSEEVTAVNFVALYSKQRFR